MSSSTDTRRHPRRRFARRATLEIRAPEGDEVIAVPGTFESLSTGGAGLALDNAIPLSLDPGSRVELCFFAGVRGGESRTARVPARVAWARRRDGHYRVGTEFLLEGLTGIQAEVVRRIFDDEPIGDVGAPASRPVAALAATAGER